MHEMKLYEEVMLLALRDEKGTIAGGTWYEQAVAGAILSELLLDGHLRLEGSGKKKYIELASTAPTGDPLFDEVVDKIAGAKRRATAQTWVGRIAGIRNLKHRALERLCHHGILRADEDKVLLIFTRKIYPEVNPEPERRLLDRLREAVFTDVPDVDARTVVLVSLANGTGLLAANFDKKKLKARKKRIEMVVNGEMMGKATKEAVDAAQAAVMVAVMVAVMIPAITST